MPSTNPSKPVTLPVRGGKGPQTPGEIREQHEVLAEGPERLGKKVVATDSGLSDLLLQGNDGAERDPADVGSSNFERDQELSLAQNAREMADQARLALHLFDEDQYGPCEVCGNPIGEGKLQIFPQVTMYVACKQHGKRH